MKDRKFEIGNFGKVLVRFASAQLVSNLLRIISGFFVVKFIAPNLYGQFTGVGIYLGYISLGHGGIINGLGRELPYELGRKNDKYAKQMASSVYVLTSLISLIASLLFGFMGAYYFMHGESLTGLICTAYFIIGGLNFFNKQFLPVLYRTNNDFDSLSRQNLLVGFGNVFSIILVYYFGIYGLIARGVFLAGFEFILLFKNKPYELSYIWKFKHFKRLFKTGFPIFMVGHVTPLWITFMNTIIFNIGGSLSFGLYSLCTIIQSAFGVIPDAFSKVIYPRMSIMLGQGEPVSMILRANLKPVYFQFILMLVTALIGFYLLPVLVPYLLPNYINGIKAAQYMLFVPVIQSLGSLNNIYNVVKKQRWYFFSLLIGAVVGSIFVMFTIKQKGFVLEVFPQGILLGTAIQQILSLLFIFKLKNNYGNG